MRKLIIKQTVARGVQFLPIKEYLTGDNFNKRAMNGL